MGVTPPREHHPESPEGRLAAALAAGDAAGIQAARAAMVASVDKWLWTHARRWEEALWLRYVAGAGLEEIGDRFGVTKEAVRMWLKAAVARLRERGAWFAGVR